MCTVGFTQRPDVWCSLGLYTFDVGRCFGARSASGGVSEMAEKAGGSRVSSRRGRVEMRGVGYEDDPK